jgi:hypothetical protein
LVVNTNPIIIAGHSHVVPLGVPANDGPPELFRIERCSRLWGLKGRFPRDAEYWDALVRHAPTNAIALMWGGNEHHAHFLVEQEIPFDFVLRDKDWLPLAEGAIVLPELLIREKFRRIIAMSGLSTVLGALKAAAPDSRIAVVGPPPPKSDNALLPRLFRSEFHKDVSEVKLTPQLIRLKLWCVVRDVFREVAEQNGVEFIEVPDEVKDDIGFLKEEYWENDMTHANAACGDILQKVLIDRL